MKSFVIVIMTSTLLLFQTSCEKPKTGCTDMRATNYDASADESCSSCCTFPPKQGGVLFWSEDPNAISTCGTFTVTISNGKKTTITGFYNNPGPANCINQVGGYVLLDVGTYQYTVTRSLGCPGGNGTITVTEGCNLVKLD